MKSPKPVYFPPQDGRAPRDGLPDSRRPVNRTGFPGHTSVLSRIKGGSSFGTLHHPRTPRSPQTQPITPVNPQSLVSGILLSSLLAAPASTVPEPFLPVPNPAQLRWHKAEYLMFIHFGMKTFYPNDDHMGYGKEDPQRFNPVKFDADQWVAAANTGGFKGIVLTTKHHDGFCNWPTDTTAHSVRSSPWRDGRGDIVRDLTEACDRGGLYFGLYISIIDKHFEAAGSPRHADYGSFYHDQLKELSTRYGTIDEYWFDGFNAAGLKMDYPKLAALIRETQPEAVVYDSGTMVGHLPDRCIAWPGNHGGIKPDQDYRREINGTLRWYPNEPSIILQGNWFHNGKPVSSLETIQNEYLNSTGHGVTPLLNIAPNSDGLIDSGTVEVLGRFKSWVDELHTNNLARTPAAVITSDTRRGDDPAFGPNKATDGEYDTYFATDDSVTTATIEVELGAVREIDGFILQEYIPLGQRVDAYTLECRVDGKWTPVFSGRKIGYKRILLEGRSSAADHQFPAADAVRLKIDKALACPLINNFQIIGRSR